MGRVNVDWRLALARFVLCCVTGAVQFEVMRQNRLPHGVPAFAALIYVLYGVTSLVLVKVSSAERTIHIAVPIADVIATLGIWEAGGNTPLYIVWVCFTLVATISNPSLLGAGLTGLLLIIGFLILAANAQQLYSPVTLQTPFLVIISGLFSLFLNSGSRRDQYVSEQLEQLTTQLAILNREPDLVDAFVDNVTTALAPSSIEVSINKAEPFIWSSVDHIGKAFHHEEDLEAGGKVFGRWKVTRESRFSELERNFIAVATYRLAAALLRLSLNRDSIEKARLEEQLQFADELHDHYLQTLAAIDMQAEAVRQAAKRDMPIDEHLLELKDIVRAGAHKARDFISFNGQAQVLGPGALRSIIEERWSGTKHLNIAENVKASDTIWKAIDMLVREGVNNAKGHARPSAIEFHLSQEGSMVMARLENDGCTTQNTFVFGYGLNRLDKVVRGAGGLMFVLSPQKGKMALVGVFPTETSA